MRILHIVERTIWERATETGEYLPAAFDDDGFVHFSFPHQVQRTANAFYRDATDLIVVEIESDEVPSRLVVEDSYGGGEEFPHVYGPVPTAACVRVHELTRNADGDWVFSAGG